MYFLATLCESMLMHIITSSIKNEYKRINKCFCLKNPKNLPMKVVPLGNHKNSKRRTSTENGIDVKQMQQLMEKHYQLTLLAKDANIFFGIPMLIALSSQFEYLTMYIYYAMSMFYLASVDYIDVICFAYWIIMRGLHIWYIVQAWDSIANEVKFSYKRWPFECA